jgi:hypothetical protein
MGKLGWSLTVAATALLTGCSATGSTSTANSKHDSYDYIDAVGPVRAGTQTVTPGATTIYTLYSTNQYGRATKAVTVNVH